MTGPVGAVYKRTLASVGLCFLLAGCVLQSHTPVFSESDAGALIQVDSKGVRHGPPEVLARLAKGEDVDPSLYHSLLFVMLGLSALILVTALWRKRLFLGMALALYGLATFNLHYWGFGVPFLLIGSWYLVRAYRLGQKLKLAKAEEGPTGPGGPARRAQPNKRYTPPVTGTAKPPKPPKSDS